MQQPLAVQYLEYAFNRPEISDKTKATLHHLMLDLVASYNYVWRAVHSPLIDDD